MTTRTQPITKLYKRCQWSKHSQCPGKFEDWSVCSCECHADASAVQPHAEISQQDTEAAVAEAQAIVTPSWGKLGSLRERAFTPCAEHAPSPNHDLDDPNWSPATRIKTLRMFLAGSPSCKSCAECSRLTLINARAYARHLASKPSGLKLQGYNSSFIIPAKEIRGWRSNG